jgi:methylmalonyl-CoA mutase|tara:strand:+ start:54 stop:464 length:411 start_codon:yes stop_codon:yes gene_type:complete
MPRDTADVEVKKLLQDFFIVNGRRPRVLLSTTNENKSEIELQKTALRLAEIGLDVDFAPSSLEANHLIKQALENDVHYIILYNNSEASTDSIREIKEELSGNKRFDIVVVVWDNFKTENSIKKQIHRLIEAYLDKK